MKAHGVVIGKFLPFHQGHRLLVETALGQCSQVDVIICEKPDDPIPGILRQTWIQTLCPSAKVRVIDDRYDENDSKIWAENTIRWLRKAPDLVFTSEAYGEPYAAHMGATHIPVDPARCRIPCSGTIIRENPYAHWQWIDPPVRAWYAKRVCILGAESTGTTTLSQDLAQALHTEWVAEYGRELSEIKASKRENHWTSEEFHHIAQEQTRREDEASQRANRILVCDTNAFATCLWRRRYLGSDDPALWEYAAKGRCDLYLLTGDEIPFVQDGFRDGEHIRHQMQQQFREALAQQPVPWYELKGNSVQRLKSALRILKAEGFPIACEPWPINGISGLQPGVNLLDNGGLLDRMEPE